MILYATIESERASKGQGGECLEINITGGKKELIFELKAKKEGANYVIDGYAINYNSKGLRAESYFKYEIAGKK